VTDLASQLRLSMFVAPIGLPLLARGAGFDIAIMVLALVLMVLTLAATWCDVRARRYVVRLIRPRTAQGQVRSMVLALLLIGGLASWTSWSGYRLSRDIQDQRLLSCRQANERHDTTLRVLDERIAGLPPGGRARAEASKAFTIALIEAIAPRRDCTNLVH
jgi:hypothetical protein